MANRYKCRLFFSFYCGGTVSFGLRCWADAAELIQYSNMHVFFSKTNGRRTRCPNNE